MGGGEMKADGFFEVAKELTIGKSDAHVRTAANRAYYAIYHCCLALLDALPETETASTSDSKSTHRQVIEVLKNYSCAALSEEEVRRVQRIGRTMDACFRLRKDADYRIDGDFNRKALPMQMDRARQVLEAAEELAARSAA